MGIFGSNVQTTGTLFLAAGNVFSMHIKEGRIADTTALSGFSNNVDESKRIDPTFEAKRQDLAGGHSMDHAERVVQQLSPTCTANSANVPIRASHNFKERRHRFYGKFFASNDKKNLSGLGR